MTSSDLLPIASFAARTTGSEPGLVVVAPSRGKITYWETITNASSFVPGQTSSGVQGTVPGMLNGELITDIINAEPAGFILTFSHGRVAHLTVRDQMGRPGIGIQFMRKFNTAIGGGIFGSIRNVFGGDRRKEIAAVKAGSSTKGQRDIIIATEDGVLEFWTINLGVGNSMIQEVGIKEEVLEGLKHFLPDEAQNNFQFKILDINVGRASSHSQELTKQGDGPSTQLVVLAALSHGQNTAYYIVEMTVGGHAAKIRVVHHIKCYNSLISEGGKWKPRLCVPKPYQTAFVLFETAVVLFSMAKVEETPSSQLLMERDALPDPFQDCIKFQDDAIYKVLAFALEDQDGANKHGACVIAVQGFGNVRITSMASDGPVEDPEEAKITLKSKIEQAVFFGTIRQNPLDLTSASNQDLSKEDVEEAALEISNEILGSSSKYLPKMTPSVDQQMRLRAKALEDLMLHLQKHYSRLLTRSTKWQLLWNAEKLAAAQAMWKVQEEIQKRQPKDREECLMEYALTAIHEDYKTTLDPAKGEKDRVRHWLIYDPAGMQHLFEWLVVAFNDLKGEGMTDPVLTADYYREANDLWLAAHEALFRFREDNAQVYGLGDEVLQDGVLTTGFADLPQFWTSSAQPLLKAQILVRNTCKFLAEWWNAPADKGQAPPKRTLLHIAQRLPEQVELVSRLLTEDVLRTKDKSDNDDGQRKLDSESQKTTYLRYLIQSMAPYDNMPGAIRLAEKLGDASLLVRLNLDYIKQTIDKAGPNASDSEVQKVEQKLYTIQNHAEIYFDTLGDKWANAHFQRMIYDGDLGTMLQEAQDDDKKQPYLTNYLRSVKRYGKISWINDVIGQHDYHNATTTLNRVAETQETDLWNKRTELCLAKLANLAAREKDPKVPGEISTSRFNNAVLLIDIQENLYAHVLPVTRNAIDATAAHEIALDTFGKRVVAAKSAAKALLSAGLIALVKRQTMRPDMLVDVLTLMDPRDFEGRADEDPDVLGQEFTLALNVVEALPNSDLESNSRRDALQRLVWRRAMIRDDWTELNNTASKSDDQVEGAMIQSTLFNTIFQSLKRAHDERLSVPRLWSPTEILDTVVFPDVLRARFKENERDTVEIDLEAEQKTLARYVEKGRLQVHFEGLITAARGMMRNDADRAGDEVARDIAHEAALTAALEE